MNSRTIAPEPLPPPKPRYELELSHTEMLHLGVVLFRHEKHDRSNLYHQLPHGVREIIETMPRAEADLYERAGWRSTDVR